MNLLEYNIYECVRMMKHIILLYFSKYTFERFVKQIVFITIYFYRFFSASRAIVHFITGPYCAELTKRVRLYALVAFFYVLVFTIYLYIGHIAI